MIVIGLLLAGVLGSVVAVNDVAGAPLVQRVTSTPSPTPMLRATLVVRPLPILTPITTTVVISATPDLTTTLALTATQSLTLPVRATPTPVLRATPTVIPSAGDAPDAIINFTANATRLRGQIDLRWEYVGAPFAGAFTMERSANGGAWRYVASCAQPYVASETSYRCRDTGLTSGATYQYRICITDAGYSCADVVVAETDAIKSP